MMWVVLLVALVAVGLAIFSLLSSQRNEALQALQATEIALQMAQTALANEQLTGSQTAQAIIDAPTATDTITPSQTSTVTLTATDTPSPTPATPIAEAMRDLAARSGPDSTYPIVATLEADMQLDITGISVDGAWFQVLLPDGSLGWLATSSTVVSATGNLSALPIVPPPTNTSSPTDEATETNTPRPTRTPTPRPTRTPTDTNTPTPRPTRTPSNTPTRTPTNTDTPTPRPTRTPSNTPTRTPTDTDTPTDRPTRTPTDTNTPTDRPTRTPSRTPTRTPSRTPSNTPVSTSTVTSVAAVSSDVTDCGDALPSRLSIGDEGIVTPGEARPINVRADSRANARRVGVLEVGDRFDVLEGPQCSGGAWWYRINAGELEGWILEGRDEYYIEPK
jgi:hypothetical protein